MYIYVFRYQSSLIRIYSLNGLKLMLCCLFIAVPETDGGVKNQVATDTHC